MAAKGIPTLRRHHRVMGLSKIFRSRWSALFWAGGILWTAYDVAQATAPAHDTNGQHAHATDVAGTPVDDKDVQELKKLLGNS